jgi:hypothetical protein
MVQFPQYVGFGVILEDDEELVDVEYVVLSQQRAIWTLDNKAKIEVAPKGFMMKIKLKAIRTGEASNSPESIVYWKKILQKEE